MCQRIKTQSKYFEKVSFIYEYESVTCLYENLNMFCIME